MVSKSLIAGCLLSCTAGSALGAGVPPLLHYQGRVFAGSSVVDGVGQFKFALVIPSANLPQGLPCWLSSADANQDGVPDAAVSLTVNRGLYSVMLGDTNLANMAPLPDADTFAAQPELNLRVWFNDGVKGFQQLTPDQRLSAVGYAMVAATVPDNSITGSKLAADVGAQLAALNGLVQGLTNRVNDLSNRLDAATASGFTLVSPVAQDAALLSRGFVPAMTVPSPAWATGSGTDAPAGRYGHSGVWSGQKLVVWGGSLGAGVYSSSGGVYDPASDQWSVVSSLNAPTARSGHSAVWTERDGMLVWGGYGSGGYVNSGARYQISPQSWTAIRSDVAPSGREGHVSVWAGSGWAGGGLIVWGGRNTSGLLADGAQYSTLADYWYPINVAGAPAARYAAAAVWTGEAVAAPHRLIVWGGEGVAGSLNTGGQLLFDADGFAVEWRALPALNAPAGRSRHTAVWTGTNMIVWGGQGNGSFLGDGAAYDPGLDTWTALPGSGAPMARAGHSAVWTGQEMVIWGGEGASGATASGAAYSPASNQWRTLSVSGNPLARSDAAAVWTGTELLVFGGRANGQAVASLQRLNPQPTWYFYRKP